MLKQSEGQCAVNIQESNASTPSAKPELSVIAGAQPEMPDISDELMSMFMEMLPESHQNIQQAHLDSDFDALLHHTHKLHGACCYVSLPNLKTMRLEYIALSLER